MPRLVRRKPLLERISAVMNPMDFLLWLSEELETRDWDSKIAGTQIGLALNFVFFLARANSGSSSPSEDVFSDDGKTGWLSLFLYPLLWILIAISVTNAVYTVTRTRKYRLFEANVETKPSTPSARRVRVQSSPSTASPMRYLAGAISPESAESRAHPDKSMDVWELSIWDPLPISLQLFCLFGPGHVMVYQMFLPLAPLDPRPSVTVFNTLLIQAVLSGLLLAMSSRFSQQAKDNAIIQKEVMHEYDTKFVHPRLHPVVRDVGTQISEDQVPDAREFVQVGTPTTQIRRGFQTHPNPNYTPHVQPEHQDSPHQHNVMTPQMFTPPAAARPSGFTPGLSQRSSGPRKSLPPGYAPATSPNVGLSTSKSRHANLGGNMGVYAHNKSPLKKATSMNSLDAADPPPSPRNSREMAAYEQRVWGRQSSPTKHADVRRLNGQMMGSPRVSDPFANTSRSRVQQQQERYPARW